MKTMPPSAPRRLLALGALFLAAAGCSPPGFIERMIDRTAPPAEAPALVPPAPLPPPSPSSFMFGVIVTTNSEGWKELVERDPQPGALVIDVVAGSPAAGAGVQRGDLIVAIDGTAITNSEGVTVAFRRSSQAEHEVERVRPDGRREILPVTLVPSGDFTLPRYLEGRLEADPGPVSQYLVAQNAPTPGEALSLLGSLLEAEPGFAPGHALKARRHMDLYLEKEARGESGAADAEAMRDSVARASELDGRSAEIRITAARILLALGDGARAESEATQAVSLDENSAESHYILGATRFENQKFAQALDPLLEAVELNPYNIEYYAVLAGTYLAAGARGNAEATIEVAKGVTGDPEIREQLDQMLSPSPAPPDEGRRI